MARRRRRLQRSRRDALVTTGVLLLAAAVAAAGGVVGLAKLWRATTRMEEFLVRPWEVSISSSWVVPAELKKDFQRTDATGILSRQVSIFETDLALKVAQAYSRSPWVRRVTSVRKVFPNRLDVKLELREPYALVTYGGKTYCVDQDGVVLTRRIYDLRPRRLVSLRPLVALRSASAPPPAGRLWDDVAVRGGLSMVRLCRKQFAGKVGIRSVEVDTLARTGRERVATAHLQLDAGPRVRWGRVPDGPESAAEIPAHRKTALLLALVEKEGTDLGRLQSIDVRWNAPFVR